MDSPPALTVEEVLGPGGVLASRIPSFEHRPGQVELAAAVASLIGSGGVLLAEAGTGSGKTLAYLVPAVQAGERTIVSTGTRNLQEQVFRQEVPLLAALRPGLSAAILKGRSNYLCRRRLDEAAGRPFLPGSREERFLAEVTAWAAGTSTGDRAELPWLADDEPLWSWVSAEHDTCLASRCPRLGDCFLVRARRRAAAADLVVVNHHLLLAEATADQAVALLPEAGLLVVDEAHLLEEVATRQLGEEVVLGEVGRFFREASSAFPPGRKRQGQRLVRRGFELLDRLAAAVPAEDRAAALSTDSPPGGLALLGELETTIRDALEPLAEAGQDDPAVEVAARRGGRLAGALRFVASLDETGFVYWYERRGGSPVFAASPTDVSGELPRVLFGRYRSTLLTSATLAVAGDFGYVKSRLGLPHAGELVIASPFDYRRQAVMYVPRGMPDVNGPDFAPAAARAMLPLLRLTGGRAFVLCTSRRNLDVIHACLSREGGFTVLRQGDAPRTTLLEEFRRAPAAVLVATTSFWQGIDVPGEALSAVVVDRLPFASPDDPITRGRIDRIAAAGGSAFMEYQLPAAVIMLKQGLGRLIRRRTDRGLLAVMDPRLRGKPYGRRFLASLPPLRVVDDLERLEEAYRELQPA